MPNFPNTKSTSTSFVAVLFTVLFMGFACSDGSNKQKPVEAFSIQGITQGTTYSIISDNEALMELKSEIDAILLDFDRCLSSYRDSSIVSIFSNAEAGIYHFTDIKGYFTRCFQLSESVYQISDGAFDPSIYPLVAAWGFMKNPVLEMSEEQVDSVKNLIGFQANHDYVFSLPETDDKHQLNKFSLEKIRPSLKLDFNAIAQGLSVDVICEFLDDKGFENYFVEIGGELRVKGTNKDGEFWRIGIDVADENNAIDPNERVLQSIISVKNRAVATSGNYRKFYEKDGIKRSHTIDPKTGYPVQHSLLSATVVADNAAFADAMATVFMVWGTEKTINFVNSNPQYNLDVLLQFINNNGEMSTYTSPGMREITLQ